MKIETVTGPLNTTSSLNVQSASQAAARERAISKLTGGATEQQSPVQNPTQVSPEELSAIRAPSAPAAQIDTTETPAQAETKAEEPLSNQYAILARKEKALRQREQQIRAKEQQLRASEAPKAPEKPAFDESKYISRDRIASDPFSVLAELGLSYDQLTEKALNAPTPDQVAFSNEIRALREELKALKSDSEGTKKSFQDQQDSAYKQAVNQIRVETKSFIKNNPEFEAIQATDSINDVVELIDVTFKEDGYLMSVEEAARQVEDYLVEEATKLAKLKKIQSRLAPKATSAQQPTEQKQQQMKTLTNAVSAAGKLSARDRAMLAFEGKLGK